MSNFRLKRPPDPTAHTTLPATTPPAVRILWP